MPRTNERIQRFVAARNAMLEKFSPEALGQFLSDHPECYPRNIVAEWNRMGDDARMLTLCQMVALSEGLSEETKEKARAWRREYNNWEYRRLDDA